MAEAQEPRQYATHCGACGQGFDSSQQYYAHVCPKTGFKPDSIEHQDALTNGEFSKQSKAALERGEARKEG